MVPAIYTTYKIDDTAALTIVEIENIDENIKTILDNNFVSICEGQLSSSDLCTVKKLVIDLYKGKGENWILGATAEFIIHLILKLLKFKQECMYLNLEEKSIKKGFDGLYSIEDTVWIMESKSGQTNNIHKFHANKVKIALNDLKDKLSGSNNNPWRNAYSHAGHIDVKASQNILDKIKVLSNDYTNKTYHSIEEFNLIPCGTVFLLNDWNPPIHSNILKEIKVILSKFKYKKIHVICITQKSIDLFMSYIKMENS